MRINSHLAVAFAVVLGIATQAGSAEYMQGTDRQKARAYSPAVITEGGKIVWLAGQAAAVDGEGKSLAGNFDAQAREVFRQIDLTLKRSGGSLKDLVTMTVFINDPRHGDRLTEMRRELFPDGHYPGSALITVSGFAVPAIMIEVQGVAVIGDRCSNANPCSPH
jgi:2-iminobutanoate/2-iminopropanoate deaminase